MQCHQAIAERLVRLGVRDAFTYTTDDVVHLVAELDLRGVKVRHARHEQIAVGTADGYSRASGNVGVVLVGGAVGLTNCVNALLTAIKAHSRVLVIVGETAGGTSDAAQLMRKFIDQHGLLGVLRARHHDAAAASAAADAQACYELAAGGGELVVMGIPEEVMHAEAGEAGSALPAPAPPAPLGDADRDLIVGALQETWAARRTVILAGRGAVHAGAREELIRLADAAGALLATTVMARDLFAGEPYAIGVSGNFSTPVASELLVRADLILAFGASLNYDTTLDRDPYGKARLIHVDNDPAAVGRFGEPDLAVIADARLAARSITDALQAAGHVPAAGYRTADAAERIAAYTADSEFTDASGPRGMDTRALMAALDKILPAERTVVVDGGVQMLPPVRHLRVPDPGGFVWPVEYGAIGCALGCAIGAAAARPDRLTVLAIGDGALMMTLSDLDTAVRYELPLLVVVSNNGGLAAEYGHLTAKGYDGEQVMYTKLSLEAVARSLGYEAATVTSVADLDGLADRIRAVRTPFLLDCRVTPERFDQGGPSYARRKALGAGAVPVQAP
jgi:thiamine pyrophosphate-dependent acetolactate synthase large subunit-like protein